MNDADKLWSVLLDNVYDTIEIRRDQLKDSKELNFVFCLTCCGDSEKKKLLANIGRILELIAYVGSGISLAVTNNYCKDDNPNLDKAKITITRNRNANSDELVSLLRKAMSFGSLPHALEKEIEEAMPDERVETVSKRY